MPSSQRTSHAGEPERPNLVDHRQARALTRPGCRRVPAASVTSVTRWATKVTGQPGPRIRRTAGPGRGSPRRPPVARTNFRPSPHRTAPAPVYRGVSHSRQGRERSMSIEENKAVVGRWFTEFWGEDFNPAVIDEIAAPDIRFEYSLHAPLRGRDAVRAFAGKFRAAFPDLNFWGTADLIAEGDYVVGQWEGGGTHTGEAFDDMPLGSLPANTGKVMRFTGTTVLRVENGLITEEIGLDDGVTALRQLGLIPSA